MDSTILGITLTVNKGRTRDYIDRKYSIQHLFGVFEN